MYLCVLGPPELLPSHHCPVKTVPQPAPSQAVTLAPEAVSVRESQRGRLTGVRALDRRPLDPVPLRFDCRVWFSRQGVTSILPVLREGVLTGSPEQKEEAAKALGLVIRLTSADALRPSVVSITGPLIRILGDRFSWNVKAALLETLSLLLAKVSH